MGVHKHLTSFEPPQLNWNALFACEARSSWRSEGNGMLRSTAKLFHKNTRVGQMWQKVSFLNEREGMFLDRFAGLGAGMCENKYTIWNNFVFLFFSLSSHPWYASRPHVLLEECAHRVRGWGEKTLSHTRTVGRGCLTSWPEASRGFLISGMRPSGHWAWTAYATHPTYSGGKKNNKSPLYFTHMFTCTR